MEQLVSIIMPNYNGAKYVQETINSVLAQTYTNWELLFVDDCSTDNSLEIIRAVQDERIRIFKNDHNSGAAESRNYALREAKGKWIAFLDSDDLWMPEKLTKQIAFMEKNKIAFSYTQYSEIDGESNPTGRFLTGPSKISKKGIFRYCWVGCLTVMYDKDIIGDIQIDVRIKKRNDYAIWLKVCKKANCFLLPEILAKYRRREGSISREGKLKLIKFHYRLFRWGEGKSIIGASYCTVRNLFFGVWKKIKYSRKK